MEFVAQHLALLLALHSKAFPEQHDAGTKKINAPTKSSRKKRAKKTPSHLELAFDKLLAIYTPCNTRYEKEKLAELNRIHRTPSLNLQKTGPRIQDSVHWNPTLQDEFQCPDCRHQYTMCVEINRDVNRDNAITHQRLDTAAAAAGTTTTKGKGTKKGKTTGTTTTTTATAAATTTTTTTATTGDYKSAKHGCYCLTFNCFGKVDGIGCTECVVKAARGNPPTANPVVAGKCLWDCKVCACRCICTFDDDKRQTIATANDRNRNKD